MACSCCDFKSGVGQQFTAKKAAKHLAEYRRGSVGPTTAMLRDGIVSAGLNRGQLLDIGAGIGALTFELLDRGVASAVAVDASRAYLTAAAGEAARRRRFESISFVEGDFVDVGGPLPIADVVTLDRVVCCYADYRLLLRDATRHARSGVALSYPRDRWFMRLGIWFENAFRRIGRNAFRTFVHPVGEIERVLSDDGFRLAARTETATWAADIYVRGLPAPASILGSCLKPAE